jgi:hypothetical protein
MSDELVKRANEAVAALTVYGSDDDKKVADLLFNLRVRIEALEQQVADLLADVPCACGYDNPTDVCMKHLPLVRDLTAKLAKAVEALRAVDDEYSDLYWGPDLSSIKQARAALAEIEGTNAP